MMYTLMIQQSVYNHGYSDGIQDVLKDIEKLCQSNTPTIQIEDLRKLCDKFTPRLTKNT